jgi:hypothetical protein
VATRRLVVDADNGRPDRAAIWTSFMVENGMIRANYLVYSIILAPSDFQLFGQMKRKLSTRPFDQGGNLYFVDQSHCRVCLIGGIVSFHFRHLSSVEMEASR